MTGQFAFDESGKVSVQPTKLTEDARACQGGEQQGRLEDVIDDHAKLSAWTGGICDPHGRWLDDDGRCFVCLLEDIEKGPLSIKPLDNETATH